jgi:hypothetical protein
MALEMVEHWLRPFREASEYVSQEKVPTISTLFQVFWWLQNTLYRAATVDVYADLSIESGEDTKGDKAHLVHMKKALADGLMEGYRILSKYIGRMNSSPYFLWATCMFSMTSADPL